MKERLEWPYICYTMLAHIDAQELGSLPRACLMADLALELTFASIASIPHCRTQMA